MVTIQRFFIFNKDSTKCNYSGIFFINKDWLRRAVGSTKFNQIRAFWLLEIT